MFLSGCKFKSEKNTEYYCQKYNLDCVKENIIVTFKTTKGDFDIELWGSSNPLTVSNFIKNISDNIYENSKFYRFIEYPNTKIIRGGTFNETDQYNYNKYAKSIPLEIQLTTKKEPTYNKEIGDPLEFKFLKNTSQKGSISMAKISNTKSSSTEFFISTKKAVVLEGRYSVFGKVINGFKILENLTNSDYLVKIEFKD